LVTHVAAIDTKRLNSNFLQAFRRALLDYLTCAICPPCVHHNTLPDALVPRNGAIFR
jgi:hypothetical protein